MYDPSALIDAYLDANILLFVAGLSWLLIVWLLNGLGLRHAFTAKLKAVRLVLLAIILAPLLVRGVLALGGPTGAALGHQVNLADFVVSQYLQGRFDMDPAQLEAIVGGRQMVATGAAPGDIVLVLALAFGLGFAFFTLRLAASILKLRRVLDETFVWRRFGTLQLRLSDYTSVPFSTRSLTRRIVVLPSSMLSEPQDLRIALSHELQHLRQRDVEWEFGMETLRLFFFWNPAFYIWRRQVEDLRELSCDRQALDRKCYDVAAYCQCLLRVCHNSLKRRRLFAIAAPVVALIQTDRALFGRRPAQVLRRRMVSLIDGRAEHHPRALMAALLLPLVAVTLLTALSIQRPADWSQDRLMLSAIINLERLQAMNTTFGQPDF